MMTNQQKAMQKLAKQKKSFIKLWSVKNCLCLRCVNGIDDTGCPQHSKVKIIKCPFFVRIPYSKNGVNNT